MVYSALLIDNDPKTINVMTSILKSEGFRVSSALSIGEAVEALTRSGFDIILLEGSLITDQNIDFIRECKLKRPEIIVTVTADEGNLDKVIEFLRLGAEDYILKPYSTEKLSLNVKKLLKKLDYRSKLEKEKDDFQKKKNLQSLGFLARGIAHDFNNMLAAILGHIEVADSLIDRGKKEEVKTLLLGSANGVNQAKKITAALLTFAEGGRPVKEIIDLKIFFKRYVLPGFKAESISVSIDCKDELFPVSADPDQLVQVFNSVLDNAFKVLEGKGSIQISCYNIKAFEDSSIPVSSGDYVAVKIKDSGRGISKDVLPHIFDPYFTTREIGEEKGVGLGLAICHSIIQRHNGYITAESEPGKGTEIAIFLPKSDLGVTEYDVFEPERITFQPEPDVADSRVKRILVMDDESLIRTIVKRSLQEMGYNVATAHEGEMAVEIYNNALQEGEKFDAVILDLTNNLGMGGIDTLKKLKAIDPEIKALVVTGYSNDPIVTNFKDNGFYGCLIKPFKYERLKQSLKQLFLEPKLKNS